MHQPADQLAITRDELHAELHVLGALAVRAVEDAANLLRGDDGAMSGAPVATAGMLADHHAALRANVLALLARPLALHDRHAVAALLATGDELRRIGSYAARTAAIQLDRDALAALDAAPGLRQLAELALVMLRDSLAAHAASNLSLARATAVQTARVDHLRSALYRELLALTREDLAREASVTSLLWLVHGFARIAVRAANICAQTIAAAQASAGSALDAADHDRTPTRLVVLSSAEK